VEITAPYNEELIVQYLLGELTEEQRVEIEDHAFQDQQYMQNILAVESDLIDEYVRGEVPRDRLQKFDRHFLASDERLRKVEFARALATVASESQAAEAARPVSAKTPVVRQGSLLAFLRGFSIRAFSPATAFSMAVALVLVIGAAWLIRDRLRLRAQVGQLSAQRQAQEARQRELEKQVADERARGDELAARVEQERKEARESVAPTAQRERQQLVAPASPATLVALSLLPGLSRAGNAPPALVISPAVRTVRLQVGVDPEDDYRSFGVELRTLGGQRIWSHENLSPRATRGGRQLVLNLPASLFAAGRYELSLRGTTAEGTSDDIGYYYFEVLKK
jgi:hypothetical protein